ncbi:putative G-type lectin S-receptor-like serine/threonine-protein kinase At1g61610 [Cornus florida]|uniref:putative G-type lectin S-receptor-like serine/threonine-protein kinase At1g61610 n=1 Tax=Cornus florida TaxID=4283 RepID=UPI00289E066D|nr:putative G-type lectin S-receptor-like serine/threonine-protein kinase At1g61610 [Cornus florida]
MACSQFWEYKDASSLSHSNLSPGLFVPSFSHWMPPTDGVVKCNVDEPFFSSSHVGGGGAVFQDSRGTILQTVVFSPFSATTATVAEAICVRKAVLWAISSSFARVWFECDSMIVIQAVSGVAPGPLEIHLVVFDVQVTLRRFNFYRISHVYRTDGEMMSNSYRSPARVYLCSFLFISQILVLFSQAANNIPQGQLVRDGETILSSGENFVLGFFSPENSTSRYVGIWYKKVSEQTVIWVANRESPISGKNGTLTVGNDGNLLIADGNGKSVWSTNASISGNSTAVLQESADLVLNNDTNHVLWQSFAHPTDTFLTTMKAYANDQIGEIRSFTSWKSPNDPSPGNYSMGIDPRGSPQIVVWEQNKRRWRSGHWDGQFFMGAPRIKALYSYGFKLNNDADGEYFTYTTMNTTQIVRFMITWDGFGEHLFWEESNKNWTVLHKEPSVQCDEYNKCGNFGLCTVGDSQFCTCIEGFEAHNTSQWNNGNWSGGCVRRTPLQCDNSTSSDGFLAVEGLKFPDYADTVTVKNISECQTKCLTNCSCIAYAYLEGIDCMIWGGDLLDVERLEEGGGTLYVRVAESELGKMIIIAVVFGLNFEDRIQARKSG